MRSTRKDDRRALTKAMMDLAEAYDLDIDEDDIRNLVKTFSTSRGAA